jgi:hypothetical protein
LLPAADLLPATDHPSEGDTMIEELEREFGELKRRAMELRSFL